MLYLYMLKIIEKLEKEFNRCLDWGFGPDNKIYEYIEDLKMITNKVKELENE